MNQKELSYFNRSAKVIFQGKEYSFSEADLLKFNKFKSNYWHHKNSPSSWLVSMTVKEAKGKFTSLPRELIIDLCAKTLNITKSEVERILDWNANYLAWHDGGTPEDYHSYLKKEK